MNIGRFLAIGGVALVLIVGSYINPAAAPHYGGWAAPVHLDSPINSGFIEQAATLSSDSLTIYFTSTRPCGAGDLVADANIWISHRGAIDDAWQEPSCLEMNMDGYDDSNPSFSRDGHWMFFVSNRPGGLGVAGTPPGRDIWVTWRAHVHDDHAWGEPVNAGPVLNSELGDAGPSYFENEGGVPQLLFTSQRSGRFDLWIAEFLNFQFSTPHPISELNTADQVESGPSIRHDGLEILFFRGPVIFDIFTATRDDPSDPWSTPVRVDAPISSEFNEQAPRLSKDGQTLFFSSNRPGTLGDLDIWMATREKLARTSVAEGLRR